MDLKKFNQEAINAIYKTAQIGLSSISNVSEKVTNSAFKQEHESEYEGYEKFISELLSFIKENDYETKEVNPMKKAFMWTSIKLNTLTDDSCGHIAELMLKGTIMGITEMQEMANSGVKALDEKILSYCEKLKSLMEQYEENLKKFL